MKLLSLQAARFWAALLVVLHHASFYAVHHTHQASVLSLFRAYGWAGVDLFFVISGVVIAMTARGLTWQQFILKRARRILPLYFGIGVPSLMIVGFFGGVTWRQILATLTLWPFTDRITMPIVFGSWTLCFEILFYAATAITLWRRWTLAPLLILFAAAVGLRTTPLLQYLGNPIIFEFLFGVAIVFAPRPKWAVWAVPIGMALLVGLHPHGYLGSCYQEQCIVGIDAWRRLLIAGVPAAIMVWGATAMELRGGVITYLGDASYSIYLTHPFAIVGVGLVLTRFAHLPPDLLIVVTVAAAVLLGWRVYELFEKPALAYLGRRMAKPAAAAA